MDSDRGNDNMMKSDGPNGSVSGAGKTPASTYPSEPMNTGMIKVQPLRRSEMQPSYKQDLGLESVEHGFYGSMINCLGAIAGSIGQIPACFCCPNPYKEVQQGSVGLVSRFGQFYRSEDPGLVRINPCSESLKVVDVKITLAPIPKQTVMTRDTVYVGIESVACYHVSNPYRAAYGITDVRSALIERAQTTLRNVVGARTLQSLISDREQVALEVQEIVESVADKWGVQVESILIKDITFSKELQDSLSSAATQKRIGEAKVIAARAEVDAAKLMRQAADFLASKSAMQIRQLEALQAMAKGGNRVIFVPMGLDMPGGSSMADASGNVGSSNQNQNDYNGARSPSANDQDAGNGGGSSNRGMSLSDVAALNQIADMQH